MHSSMVGIKSRLTKSNVNDSYCTENNKRFKVARNQTVRAPLPQIDTLTIGKSKVRGQAPHSTTDYRSTDDRKSKRGKVLRGQQALLNERLNKLKDEFAKQTLEGTLIPKPENKETTQQQLRALLGREPIDTDYVNFKWSMANRTKRRD